jgi:hypothetical protein
VNPGCILIRDVKLIAAVNHSDDMETICRKASISSNQKSKKHSPAMDEQTPGNELDIHVLYLRPHKGRDRTVLKQIIVFLVSRDKSVLGTAPIQVRCRSRVLLPSGKHDFVPPGQKHSLTCRRKRSDVRFGFLHGSHQQAEIAGQT